MWVVGVVQPVVKDQGVLLIVAQGLARGLDDQRSIQAAVQLIAEMGVVPVGPWPRGRELVPEGATRWNGRLGEFGHAVHGKRNGKPMPVNGRGLLQEVAQGHADSVTLRNPDLRSRYRAVVGPCPRGQAAGWRPVGRL